jgi:cell division protein FtsL
VEEGVSTVAANRPRVKPIREELPQRERAARRERRMARLRVLLFAGAVVGALWTVVARQTAGYERERQLGELRQSLAVAEAEHLDLTNRIQALQTRARITRVARERLGMHVAHDDEVVLLPLPAENR